MDERIVNDPPGFYGERYRRKWEENRDRFNSLCVGNRVRIVQKNRIGVVVKKNLYKRKTYGTLSVQYEKNGKGVTRQFAGRSLEKLEDEE